MDRLRDYFKCYDPRFLAWTWGGVAVLAVASFAGLAFEKGSIARFACAAMQAATMSTLIVSAVLRMRHLDELQRRIQLESIAVAFAVGASAVTGWGYFEHAGAPHFDWGLWIWPILIGAWLAAFMATRRRYR
jgi:hypothetical protein